MNFRKREREASEVETGALADILFFLLMFFLMISTLASPDAIRLLLPKADSTKVTPPVVESIRVSVDANNNFFIDGNAQPLALGQVDGQLKEILKTKNDLEVSKPFFGISSKNYQTVQIHKALEAYLETIN